MNTLKKTAAGAMLGGALLVGGGLGLAHAAPPAPQAQTAGDGMVDVTVSVNGQQIGVIRDVTIGNAATLAGSVCPVGGIDTNALTNLDVSGTVAGKPCTGMSGLSYAFGQNVAAEGTAEAVPGQQSATAATPSTVSPGQQAQQNG